MTKANYLFLPLILLLIVVQFHDDRSFKRELINYDDNEFIEPIREIDSVRSYIQERVFAKDSYAFPLRDLSFVLDFKLSDALGVNTFWITNFILFYLVLLILLRLYGEIFPNSYWGILLVALLAFHPISVEMIHWASNRKHLLVALILSWATLRVWRTYQAKTKVTSKHWIEYFAYYLLAWMCWPSAVLWIIWPQILFFKSMTPRGRAIVLSAAALIAGWGIRWTMNQNTSYDQSGAAAINFFETSSLAVQSLGRGFFNMILPIKIAPYYTYNSFENWLGAFFLLSLSALILFLKRRKKINWQWNSPAAYFLILGMLLFIPNSLVFLGYYEFVWADRYLYTPLPYWLAALGLLNATRPKKTISKMRLPVLKWGGAAAIISLYIALSWTMTTAWQNDQALFQRCASVEQSPKCIYLAVEKNFDESGCRDLGALFKAAREMGGKVSKVDFGFSSQLPLYEAICISEMRPTAQQKLGELKALKSVYPVSESLAVGEVWVHMQLKDLKAALRTAQKTYLNTGRKFSDVSPKVINIMKGQMEALCDLSGEPKCHQELSSFNQRTQSAPLNPGQVTWAKERSIRAFFTGR